MEAYKFETRILERGILEIPQLSYFSERDVEVLVLLKKDKSQNKKSSSIENFISKWAGTFSIDSREEDIKYDYLMDKQMSKNE